MSILTTLTNVILHIKQKVDAKNIAIYNQKDNIELFLNVKYIEGTVSDDLKMMEHPTATGVTIIDHVINEAKSGSIKLLIHDNDSTSLNEILDCFNANTPLVIKIKNEVFSNMYLSAKPVKADTDHFDSTVYDLSFKEVIQAITQYVKMSVPQVKQVKNASTLKTGQKKPKSTLASIKSRIKAK